MIVSTAVIFYHPMVAMFIILIMILLEGFFLIENYYGTKKLKMNLFSNQKKFNALLAFMIIIFIFWYISFTLFTKSIRIAVSALLDLGQNSGSISVFQRSNEIIQNTNASLFLIVNRFVKLYGPVSFYIAGGIACLFFIVWAFKNKNVDFTEVLFGCLFLGSLVWCGILTFVYAGMNELIRTLSFALVLATILIGLVLTNRYDQISSDKWKLLINIVLIGLISYSAIFGLLNIYPSPWIGEASPSMTKMNQDGYYWFLENRNSAAPLYINSVSIYKYDLYAFATDPLINYKQSLSYQALPGHFGYITNTTISQSLNTNIGFVVVQKYDFTYYYAIPGKFAGALARF